MASFLTINYIAACLLLPSHSSLFKPHGQLPFSFPNRRHRERKRERMGERASWLLHHPSFMVLLLPSKPQGKNPLLLTAYLLLHYYSPNGPESGRLLSLVLNPGLDLPAGPHFGLLPQWATSSLRVPSAFLQLPLLVQAGMAPCRGPPPSCKLPG